MAMPTAQRVLSAASLPAILLNWTETMNNAAATAASKGIAKRATIDRVVTALYKKMGREMPAAIADQIKANAVKQEASAAKQEANAAE